MPNETYTLYVEHQEQGETGLIQLSGTDPTVNDQAREHSLLAGGWSAPKSSKADNQGPVPESVQTHSSAAMSAFPGCVFHCDPCMAEPRRRLSSGSLPEVGSDLRRLIRCQFPGAYGTLCQPCSRSHWRMVLSLMPSSADSCFGVIGSLLPRT